MKNKILIMGLVMTAGLVFSGCRGNSSDSASSMGSESTVIEMGTTEITETTEALPSGVSYIDDTRTDLGADAVILTMDDIFIENVNSGYIAPEGEQTYMLAYMINTEEQLEALPPEIASLMNGGLREKMLDEYPLGEYVYFVNQENVSCTGYFLEADSVIIDGDRLFFGYSDKSYKPAPESMQGDAMGGFAYIGAIPVSYLTESEYMGWIVP